MAQQDTMLAYHLQHNHYPPVPGILVPVAQQAIDLVVAATLVWSVSDEYGIESETDQSVWTQEVEMPEGFPKRSLTVEEIVSGLHLDGFIEQALAADNEADDVDRVGV